MTDTAEVRRKLAFAELKPKCIAVSKLVLRSDIDAQVSRQLVKALEVLLSNLQELSKEEGIMTPALGDYVFFPLSHIFGRQQKFADRVIELSLLCLRILIAQCWHVNISGELAKQLMVMVTFIMGGSPQGDRPSRASEDTKLAAGRCIDSLFAGVARSTDARNAFGLFENTPSIGHCLTVLLDILAVTSFTDLQVSTISAIQHLFNGCISDDDILASFLPGTVSTLCKFLDSRTGSTQKSKALVKGIETLSDVLRIVLMDVKTSNLPSSDGLNQAPGSLIVSTTTIRTEAWLHATAEQVRMGLTGVCGLRGHRMIKVRSAILPLCRALARDCSQSLESSLPVVIDTIISLSADKEGTLSTQAQDVLSTLASFNDQIVQVLQNSLHGWILSLPRVLQSNDEDKKSHLLREIAVSFKILSTLGQNSEILLDLFSRNMKDSILSLSEYNIAIINSESIVADALPSMDLIRRDVKETAEYPTILLSGKIQEDTSNSSLSLLKMLGGTSIGLRLAQGHIREARVGGDLSKTVSIWMALNMLQAAQKHAAEEEEWLADSTASAKVAQLMQELYAVALSSLTKTYDVPEIPPELTCISLEAIACAADSLGQEFRMELVDVLYPIVHLFGSSVSMVQNHAIITLESIAKACGYTSTSELLVENADYLVNAVSLKLNMFDVQPQAPAVLLMMVKLSGPQIIPFLDDIVSSIFAALENFHGYEALAETLFAVLKGIVEESGSNTEGIRLVTDGKMDEPPEFKNRLKHRPVATLEDILTDINKIQELQSRPLIAEELQSETASVPKKPWGKDKSKPKNPFEEDLFGEEEEDIQPPRSDPEPPKPSATYTMIESIARLSQNFMTSQSPSLRLHLLQLVSVASPLLANEQDNFLPLIHQLWPVVVERLKDTESYVVITTLNTITRLCIDCGDFLSSRIEEIWPVLREIALTSKKKVDEEQMRWKKTTENSEREVVRSDMTGNRRNPTAYAAHNQMWGAIVPLFEAMAAYTKITDTIFDEVVGMVAQNLVDGDEGYQGLKEALDGIDKDVVWLEMMFKGEMLRDALGSPPEPLQLPGMNKGHLITFEPVGFRV